MISVSEADQILFSYLRTWGTESVTLDRAIGRTLSEDLITDRNMPPFDRITMDGIAISHHDFKSGCRTFKINGIAGAGAPLMKLNETGSCLEVMTGAILPEGADTVIRYEDLVIEKGHAKVQIEGIKIHQNIHQEGSDRIQGTTIVKSPRLISPTEINLAATVGKDKLEVLKLPRTVVISTGDELVDISANPLPHQIRRSNSYMVCSALAELRLSADMMHISDDRNELDDKLKDILNSYDLVILSGGVSAGKYDLVPDTLLDLGVTCHFHKVAQRPGKPIWFGSKKNGPIVFGLPGNPGSTFLCLSRYVIPWLKKCLDLPDSKLTAILDSDINFPKALTYFAQVRIIFSEGKIYAAPLLGKGSGDLANLVEVDGFIEIPANVPIARKNEVFTLYQFR